MAPALGAAGDASDSSSPRGARGRVAVVQRQARVTLRLAGGFAVAATVALVVPHRTGDWLPLHLFLAGALLLAISAATQLFAVTWAAGTPPSDRLAAIQRWLLAAGVALLATGTRAPVAERARRRRRCAGDRRPRRARRLPGANGLRRCAAPIRRGAALVSRALAAGLAGCALGIAMATGLDASMYDARACGSPDAQPPRPRRARDRRDPPLLHRDAGASEDVVAREADGPRAWCSRGSSAALGATTVGFLAARPVVAAVGLSAYAAGVLGLVALLPTIRVKQLRWAGPRLVQLGAGVAWWVGATVAVAWQAGHGTAVFTPTVVGVLVVGGYAQILVAAVAYLGPVLRAGGHQQLTAGFRTTRSWLALGAANVAAIALVLGAPEVAGAAIFVWVIDTVVRVALLVRSPTTLVRPTRTR